MSCFYAVLSEEPGQVYGERIRVMKYDEDGTYTSHSIEGLEVSGLLRKQRDGKIYISPYGGTHLTVMDDAGISFPANYQSVQGMDISQVNEIGLTAGTISAHPYRIKFPNQSSGIAHRRLGYKHYELTDHLGNVRAVVSDRLALQIPFNYSLHQPEVFSYTNYYPFGMLMPGRAFSSGSYRYGFNGQLKTDEISGSGNHYTATFWEYDPRLGRRWNIDPVVKPHESPYATFANNPIWFVDPLGNDTADFVTEDGTPGFNMEAFTVKAESNWTKFKNWVKINILFNDFKGSSHSGGEGETSDRGGIMLYTDNGGASGPAAKTKYRDVQLVDVNNIAGFMLTQKLGKIPGIKGTHANPNSYRNGQGPAKGLKNLNGEGQAGEGTVLRVSNDKEIKEEVEKSHQNNHKIPIVVDRTDTLQVWRQSGPYRYSVIKDTIFVPNGTIPYESPNGNNSEYVKINY